MHHVLSVICSVIPVICSLKPVICSIMLFMHYALSIVYGIMSVMCDITCMSQRYLSALEDQLARVTDEQRDAIGWWVLSTDTVVYIG